MKNPEGYGIEVEAFVVYNRHADYVGTIKHNGEYNNLTFHPVSHTNTFTEDDIMSITTAFAQARAVVDASLKVIADELENRESDDDEWINRKRYRKAKA